MDLSMYASVWDPWTGASPLLKLGYVLQSVAVCLSVASRLGHSSTQGDRLFAVCLTVPVFWAPIEVSLRTILVTESMFAHYPIETWYLVLARNFVIIAVVLTLFGLAAVIARRPLAKEIPFYGLLCALLALAMDTYFVVAVFLLATRVARATPGGG